MQEEFFIQHPQSNPTIYVYALPGVPSHERFVKVGYTVKLLDIGLLKIKHKGRIKNASNAASDISPFTLGFTPSKDALDSVKGLSVDAIFKPEKSPVIEEVADVFRNEKDGFVTSGEPVTVTGMRLKLGEEKDRLCFVPQTESGQNVEDESRWVEVEHAKIFRNKPSELTFFAPTNLAEGVKYRLRVETSYLGKGKSRKETLSGESEVVMLKS